VTKWLAVFPLLAGAVYAQRAPAPDVYSLTELNTLFGAGTTLQVMRDGSHGIIEQSTPGSEASPGIHKRTYFDLPNGKSYSVDLNSPTNTCTAGNSGSDWSDPFTVSQQLTTQIANRPKKDLGLETINGFQASVVLAPPAKAWLDPKYNMILKLEMTDKAGRAQTVIEVKKLSFTKPAVSFAVPANCLAK
jgi:hypothetical protein